jgi:hypothetical protein
MVTITALKFLALLSTVMYAGASAYASLVEHPARMACGSALAARVFEPSYTRSLRLMFTLVLTATIASLGVWTYLNDIRWFIGSVLVFSIIPFTILAITPILGGLLRADLDVNAPRVAVLLRRWGWLNAIRSVLGFAASCVLLHAVVAN